MALKTEVFDLAQVILLGVVVLYTAPAFDRSHGIALTITKDGNTGRSELKW